MAKVQCDYCGEYYDEECQSALNNGCPACPACVEKEEAKEKERNEEK